MILRLPVWPLLPEASRCITTTSIILLLASHLLALLALAGPLSSQKPTNRSPAAGGTVSQSRHSPAVITNPHDPTTLIVTNNDYTRRPLTTRDGQRDAAQRPTPTSTTTSGGAKRQAKKLLQVDPASLFREQAANYPEDDIKRLLEQTPESIKDLYNVLNTQLDPRTNPNLTYRSNYYANGEDEDQGVREESVCLTKTRNIYPREANRQNSLVYIPNNQEFMQVIQAEICQHPDRECSYLQDSLPYGMSSVCYQKYAYKKLLYMDPLEKRMASDLFRYPSCCSCYIRSLPFDLRSANNGTTSAARGTSPRPSAMQLNSSGPEEQPVSVSQYSGDDGPTTNQTTDRSQDFTTSSNDGTTTAPQRTSKQIRRPSSANQTLVLTDDKVYTP